ncbi:MAG: hypothetical protein QXL24_02170 [Candidatus Jordarchaeaceae archaeon]
MEDFEIRRAVLSLLAFLVVVFFYLQVVLNAAVDTKKINDHRAKELEKLREGLARKGIVMVIER